MGKGKKSKTKVSKEVKKYVKRIIDNRIEDKQTIPANMAPGTVGFPIGTECIYVTNPAIYLINGLAQGVGLNQRIGMQARCKFWEVYGYLENRAASTASFFVRVIAFVDRQSDLLAFDGAQLLADNTAGNAFNSPFNITGSKRYNILMDKVMEVTVGGGSTNIDHRIPFHWKFKKPVNIKYGATITGIAGIESNAIYLAFISENTTQPQVRVAARMVYEDA